MPLAACHDSRHLSGRAQSPIFAENPSENALVFEGSHVRPFVNLECQRLTQSHPHEKHERAHGMTARCFTSQHFWVHV